MERVKVSPKFQILIPKNVRKNLHIKAGMEMQMLESGNCIQLVPLEPIENLRGFVKGIDPDIQRDEDDRL